MRLLPGGLGLAVPVGAFHSVGKYVGERRRDLGVTRGSGGGKGGRNTHVCEEERGKGDKSNTTAYRIRRGVFNFFRIANSAVN